MNYSLNIFFRQYDGDMLWVFQNLVSSPTFWLLTLVALPVCLLPDILVNVYNTYRPTKLHSMEERHSSQDNGSSINYSETSIASDTQVIFSFICKNLSSKKSIII